MRRLFLLGGSAFLFLGGCGDMRDPPPRNAAWSGHTFREVRRLGELPAALQRVLGAGLPGEDGIADRNGRYNSTDFVDSDLPDRRFLVAGVDGDTALVAVERGGIGWNLQILLFSGIEHDAKVEKRWVLQEEPRTLAMVLEAIPRAIPYDP